MIGVHHEWGYGCTKDAAALPQYAATCDLKNANGCFNLAGLHLRGLGPPSDADALTAYDRACDLSDDEACDRAAAMRACADKDNPDADACAFVEKLRTN
jgi:TPR repeat protein